MWSEKAVSRKGGGGSLQESLSCTCFIFCFPAGFYLGIVSFDCFLTEPQTSSVRQGGGCGSLPGGGHVLFSLDVQSPPSSH